MSDAKCTVPMEIVDARSPANQYLVRLLEDKGTISFQPPTEERVQLVFEVLDNLTPRLGVFSRVIALIRAELHGAVYSQSLSCSRLCKEKASESFVHIPFFSVVRQMQADRDEDLDAVRCELGRVNAVYIDKKGVTTGDGNPTLPGEVQEQSVFSHMQRVRLLQREEELLSLRESLSAAQEKNHTLQAAIAALQMEAEERERRNSLLMEEARVQERAREEERATQRQYMADLRSRLDASCSRIQELEGLSAAYSALRRVFQAPLSRRKQNMLSLGKVPAGRTGPSMYLQATRHMYQQLLQVQNSVMDDFDNFLENQLHASEREEGQGQQDEETQMFLSRLAEISAELSLLDLQRESLEQHKALSAEVSSPAQSPGAGKTDSQKTEDRSIASLLSQALYPDETLLNRYAAMIYTSSDNGSIFQELEGARLCDSCGEKTVLCPHKVGGTRVICLPKNCSHIKLCRPRAHQCSVQAKIAASMAQPGKAGTEITQATPGSPGNQSAAADSQAKGLDVLKLEKVFEEQLRQKRDLPRALSLASCISLTQQLLVTLIRQLEAASPGLPIQETVWGFLRKRYVNEDISCWGLQDYLAAVVRYAPHSQVLSLLGLVLQRDLDPTVLSYVLLMAETVAVCPLSDMAQLQLFLHTQYPFLEETERDSLVLEFTSYSRRCVSPQSVMGFILHLILQHHEPLITECEDELSTHPKKHTDCLTAEELSGALEELCPLRNPTQIQSLIRRCPALYGSSLIPLRKAAQITAYQLQRDKQRAHVQHGMEESAPSQVPTGDNVRRDTGCKDASDLQILHSVRSALRNRRQ